jgi:hypothetical protein
MKGANQHAARFEWLAFPEILEVAWPMAAVLRTFHALLQNTIADTPSGCEIAATHCADPKVLRRHIEIGKDVPKAIPGMLRYGSDIGPRRTPQRSASPAAQRSAI